MARDATADALAEAFPDTHVFVVLPQSDWDLLVAPLKLIGLPKPFAAIQLLNLVRVVSLFWIGAHRPALFSSSHTVLWQSAVVLFSVLLFLFWASREQRTQAAAAAGAHGPSESR